MKTILVVTSGEQNGFEFPLNGNFHRIGSSPGMEVQIDNIELHALTLQLRCGAWYAINQADRPIQLDGKLLAPQKSALWLPGTEATLGNGITLQLNSSDRILPQREFEVAPLSRSTDSPEVEIPEESDLVVAKDSRQKKLLIALMVIATGIMLLSSADLTGSGRAKDLHALVQDFMSAPHDSRLRTVRRGLQRAYNFEKLGYKPEAVNEYGMLRQQLTQQRRDDDPLFGSTKVHELEIRAMDFVRARLQQLL